MFSYRLKIEGLNLDRFLTECAKKNIILKNIRKKERKILIAEVNYANFKNLFAKVDTKCYNITILKKGLVPLFRENIIKRSGFLAGILIGIFTIILLCGIYWRVDVNCSDTELRGRLVSQLQDAGIFRGSKISDVDFDDAEILLLKNNPELASVSVHREGVVLKVDIFEALPQEKKELNIYSTSNAVITGIVVINGVQKVNEGDVVKKGDILVEASEDGKKAVAVVFGKVYITGEEEFEKFTREVEYTGRETSYINFEFAGFNLGKVKETDYKEYETVTSGGYVTDFLLPLKYKKTVIKEAQIIIEENNFEEYEDLLKKSAYEKALSLYESGKILDIWYNIKDRGDIITVTAILETEKIISEE